MSSDSDSYDVSEGTVVNPVLQSQQDKPLKCSIIAPEEIKFSNTERQLNEPRHKKNSVSDLSFVRFSKFISNKELKIKELQRKKEEDELKECSFKPFVNKSNKSSRTFKEYYSDAMNFLLKKEDNLKKDSPEESFNFKPEICKKSERLVRTKNLLTDNFNTNRMNYTKRREKNRFMSMDGSTQSHANFFEFAPKITKTSKNIERKKPVFNLLYQDAQRRTNSKKNLNTILSPTVHSKNVLISKFLNEFKQLADLHDINKTGEINYQKFKHILRDMRFINPKKPSQEQLVLILKLWDKVAGEQDHVCLKDLKVGVMGIMGYFQPWMKDPKSQNFVIENTKKFHKTFLPLFWYRLSTRNKPLKKNIKNKKPAKTYSKSILKQKQERNITRRRSRLEIMPIDPSDLLRKLSSGVFKNDSPDLRAARRSSSLNFDFKINQVFTKFVNLENSNIKEEDSLSNSSDSSENTESIRYNYY